MVNSFTELLNDKKEAERLAAYAIKENPNINDFNSFEQALLKAFNTDTGKNALAFINDEESKKLFETDIIKERIRQNTNEREFNNIYENKDNYDVVRAVPKGEPTTAKDINVIYTPRQIKVPSYSKGGTTVKGYSKGYHSWTSAQNTFIKNQKAAGKSPKEIIANYNRVFKDEQRSSSSVKTKIFRV